MTEVPALLDRNIASLTEALTGLGALGPMLERATALVGGCLLSGGKLLIFGNGGSATDASHFASEFVVRYNRDRPGYPAISLSDSGGVLTAGANDYDFDEVFARQVRAFGRPGDVAIGMSTSGNSVNVQKGLVAAGDLGLSSIALLGRDGGKMAGLATVDLIVRHQVTARIQEMHKVLIHTICEALEDDLAGQVP